ncbi:MAG: hypothetical protein ABFS45_23555, partial [Pseudomonadota bacterium]
ALDAYAWIPARLISSAGRNNKVPLWEMAVRQWRVGSAIARFRPEAVVSLMGTYTQTASLFSAPNLVFTDSEFQTTAHAIAHPFASRIYTPACFAKNLGPKQVRYAGYHELAFLHPRYFTPNPEVFRHLDGAKEGEYIVLRLSAWDTLHDIGERGIAGHLDKVITELTARTRVFIVPEKGVDLGALERYRLRIPPQLFHDALAFARLVVSEGASTVSEAGCLGVPAIYVNSTSRSYLEDQEHRYGLVHNFRSSQEALGNVLSLLDNPPKPEWLRAQRERLVAEHIDVTEFLVNEIDRRRTYIG